MSLSYTSFPLVLACLVVGAGGIAPAPAAHAQGIWITSCDYSHSLNDDPIVYPGRPGASHRHDFVGSDDADAFSNVSSLRNGVTSCAATEDTSAYWVPASYEDGVLLTPTATAKNALFYYRRGGLKDTVTVRPMPPGLKMVLGNMHAKSPAENPEIGRGNIYWKCGPGTNPHLTAPPTSCPGTTTMSLVFQFPQCWDGVNLDSANHLSHMAEPVRGLCPASHPVPLPRLTAYWRYNVGSSIGKIAYASGAYYTAHMDVFSAWDPAAMQALVTDCINTNANCGVDPAIP